MKVGLTGRPAFSDGLHKTSDRLRRPDASDCHWAAGAMIGALGLHFYYVREMMASLFLLSLLFFVLSGVLLSGFFLWHAGKRIATWARPAPVVPKFVRATDLTIPQDPV